VALRRKGPMTSKSRPLALGLALALVGGPAPAEQWWVMLADGCHPASSLPAPTCARPMRFSNGCVSRAHTANETEWQIRTGAVRLSPKLCSLYGLTDFDGRYETWLSHIFREDVLRIESETHEAFATHATEVVAEFRIVRSDDQSLRWIERRGTIFYDSERRPERLLGISVDVTERKRATIQRHAFAETLEERVKARTRELEAENEARKKGRGIPPPSPKDGGCGAAHGRGGSRLQ
jgi:hypothetical protein